MFKGENHELPSGKVLEGIRQNYRIESLISHQKYTNIYLLEENGKLYVGKVLTSGSPVDIKEFNDEARILESLNHPGLNHPGIIPFIDENAYPPPYFLVMPLAQNGSVEDLLKKQSPIDVALIANITLQSAKALQHLHTTHGLIHRDVKPSNLLLSRDNDILLSDFGFAVKGKSNLPYVGSLKGSPGYIAPEQWNEKCVPASDQYSLAIVTYELITGRNPFFSGNNNLSHNESYRFHTEAPPASVTEADLRRRGVKNKNDRFILLAMVPVVLQALEKNPESRFPNVLTYGTELEKAGNSPRSY